MINIYTDGACKENKKNSGVGGWAFVVLENVIGQDMKIINSDCGQAFGVTNQQMEIHAVINAIKSIKKQNCQINLYSDSAYVINCLKDRWYDKWMSNGWINSKKLPVENKELWEELIDLIKKHDINFFHIKRNTTKFIRIVDGMAKNASRGKEPAEYC